MHHKRLAGAQRTFGLLSREFDVWWPCLVQYAGQHLWLAACIACCTHVHTNTANKYESLRSWPCHLNCTLGAWLHRVPGR